MVAGPIKILSETAAPVCWANLNASSALTRHRAGRRIEARLMDRCGVSLRDFSISTPPSVDAAKTARDGTTVNHRAEVQFFADVGRRFNQNLVYRLAISVCLIGRRRLPAGFSARPRISSLLLLPSHRPLCRGRQREPDISLPTGRHRFGTRLLRLRAGSTGCSHRRGKPQRAKSCCLIFVPSSCSVHPSGNRYL